MGLLDRFAKVDEQLSAENGEHPTHVTPSTDIALRADPIADAIIALLSPFLDPEDAFSGMLFAIARRYLADANSDQLREVVANLCEAADALGPLTSPPLRRATVGVADSPADGGGGPGPEAGDGGPYLALAPPPT
jgi:hypothetical protein